MRRVTQCLHTETRPWLTTPSFPYPGLRDWDWEKHPTDFKIDQQVSMNYICNYALASYGIFALIIDRTLIEEYHIQRYIYIITYIYSCIVARPDKRNSFPTKISQASDWGWHHTKWSCSGRYKKPSQPHQCFINQNLFLLPRSSSFVLLPQTKFVPHPPGPRFSEVWYILPGSRARGFIRETWWIYNCPSSLVGPERYNPQVKSRCGA